MGIVGQPLQDRIGCITYAVVPFQHRQLARDDGRAPVVPVIHDFQQVISMALTKGLKAPVIKYQQVNLGQLPELFRITAIAVRYCHGLQQTGGAKVADTVTT